MPAQRRRKERWAGAPRRPQEFPHFYDNQPFCKERNTKQVLQGSRTTHKQAGTCQAAPPFARARPGLARLPEGKPEGQPGHPPAWADLSTPAPTHSLLAFSGRRRTGGLAGGGELSHPSLLLNMPAGQTGQGRREWGWPGAGRFARGQSQETPILTASWPKVEHE